MNFSKKHKKHLSDVYEFFSSRYRCVEVCSCCDPDYDCTMPFRDFWYACPFESLLPDNVEALHHMITSYRKKRRH